MISKDTLDLFENLIEETKTARNKLIIVCQLSSRNTGGYEALIKARRKLEQSIEIMEAVRDAQP